MGKGYHVKVGSSGGIRKPSLGEKEEGAGKSPPSWAHWVVPGGMSVSQTSVQPSYSWVTGPVTSSHRISVVFFC